MPVLIFLHVAWIPRINFTRNLDAVVPGVGTAARNTAHSITVWKRVNVCPTQKIIIIPCAVGLKRDSKKRTIVLGVILHIVLNVGNSRDEHL
jgi:hypothetical protein